MKITTLTMGLCVLYASSTVFAQTADAGAAASSVAVAANGPTWRVMASPYTYHWSKDPDHRDVYMVGLERQGTDNVVWGGSYFRNSFGQPSGYLYGGKRYDNIFSQNKLFAQWTVGLLYGYKEPYQDKVPLNHNGFSPGAVFSLGWQFTPMWSAQVNVLGNSALMFQFSADFK